MHSPWGGCVWPEVHKECWSYGVKFTANVENGNMRWGPFVSIGSTEMWSCWYWVGLWEGTGDPLCCSILLFLGQLLWDRTDPIGPELCEHAAVPVFSLLWLQMLNPRCHRQKVRGLQTCESHKCTFPDSLGCLKPCQHSPDKQHVVLCSQRAGYCCSLPGGIGLSDHYGSLPAQDIPWFCLILWVYPYHPACLSPSSDSITKFTP